MSNINCETSPIKIEQLNYNNDSINYNEHITKFLEPLIDVYSALKDTWKSFAYRKAVLVLKNYHKKITSIEEIKSINGIGNKIIDKIDEILKTGKCDKTNEMTNDPKIKILLEFMTIWGVGSKKAQELYNKGYKSLDDIKNKGLKDLTDQQIIGIKYYNEINNKIPRNEVKEIEKYVENIVKKFSSTFSLTTCGSYRRGKAFCGDVDILITDKIINQEFVNNIFGLLKEEGFLTDDLSYPNFHSPDKMCNYMGICKLPNDIYPIHRRIDIKFYPSNQYAFAILYFTGSDYFNRSFRLYAKKKGYFLSDHGLNILNSVFFIIILIGFY